jgi:hypothetical protein
VDDFDEPDLGFDTEHMVHLWTDGLAPGASQLELANALAPEVAVEFERPRDFWAADVAAVRWVGE